MKNDKRKDLIDRYYSVVNKIKRSKIRSERYDFIKKAQSSTGLLLSADISFQGSKKNMLDSKLSNAIIRKTTIQLEKIADLKDGGTYVEKKIKSFVYDWAKDLPLYVKRHIHKHFRSLYTLEQKIAYLHSLSDSINQDFKYKIDKLLEIGAITTEEAADIWEQYENETLNPNDLPKQKAGIRDKFGNKVFR